MPGRDGTGPVGHGPATGRGMGFCTGSRPNGYFANGYGNQRGLGRGMGFKTGFGWNYKDNIPTGYKTRRDFLAAQKEFLKQRLDIIDSRLEELAEDSR